MAVLILSLAKFDAEISFRRRGGKRRCPQEGSVKLLAAAPSGTFLVEVPWKKHLHYF